MSLELEVNPNNTAFDEEIIDSLMDMIYRSAIKTFVTSIHNSFYKYKTMPMDRYHIIKPLLERWRDILSSDKCLNEQNLVDFNEELEEISTNCFEFIFNCSPDNSEWTLSKFFREGIWQQYFKSGEDKAKAICNKMKRILESRGSKIDMLINSGYSIINPFEFEELVATLFSKMGYETEVTPKTGDFGIDIIAKNEKETIAIQTKKYARGNNVGNRDVQCLLGAMQLRGVKANKAILITTSDFTLQAVEQAKETPIELWDGSYVSSLLRKYVKN